MHTSLFNFAVTSPHFDVFTRNSRKKVAPNLEIPIFRRNFANANGKNAEMLLVPSKESGCSSVG